MPNTLRTLGTLAGVVGLLTCLFAGLARLTGIHWLMGFEIVTLLQIGIGGIDQHDLDDAVPSVLTQGLGGH